jgi:hypothetical protein
VLERAGSHEEGLVESDGGGLLEPLGVGSQPGGAIDACCRVDGVPAAGEFTGKMGDGLTAGDLFGHPLGRPGAEPAPDCGDPMIAEGERALRADVVGTDESVFLPAQRDGHTAEGQVDLGDDRTVLDPGSAPTARTPQLWIRLLDGDLARRTAARVGQDADVFETNEVGDDLYRIEVHRGVEDLLFHTLRLKRLCAYAVDPR